MRNELRQRPLPGSTSCAEDIRAVAENADRHEILFRIVGQLLQDRQEVICVAEPNKRVWPVRLGARDLCGGDGAACPRTFLDNEGYPSFRTSAAGEAAIKSVLPPAT